MNDVIEEGQLRIRQTENSEMTPLVSILIEGNHASFSLNNRQKKILS